MNRRRQQQIQRIAYRKKDQRGRHELDHECGIRDAPHCGGARQADEKLVGVNVLRAVTHGLAGCCDQVVDDRGPTEDEHDADDDLDGPIP